MRALFNSRPPFATAVLVAIAISALALPAGAAEGITLTHEHMRRIPAASPPKGTDALSDIPASPPIHRGSTSNLPSGLTAGPNKPEPVLYNPKEIAISKPAPWKKYNDGGHTQFTRKVTGPRK